MKGSSNINILFSIDCICLILPVALIPLSKDQVALIIDVINIMRQK